MILAGTAFFAILGVAVVFGWLLAPWRALPLAILAFLAIRPSLDYFHDVRVLPAWLGGSAAAGSGLLVTLACVLLLGEGRARGERVPELGRRWMIAFLPLLASYAIGVAVATTNLGIVGGLAGLREFARVAGLGVFVPGVTLILRAGVRPVSILRACWVGAVLPIITAYYQAIAGTGDLYSGFNRAMGTFVHPNALGTFLAAIVTVALGVVVSAAPTRPSALLVIFGGIPALVLTFSRVSYLLFIVSLVTVVILNIALGTRDWRAWVARLAPLLLIVLIVASGPIVDRFRDIRLDLDALRQAAVGAGTENSLEWRLLTWAIMIKEGLAAPLLGHGLGTANLLNPVVAVSLGRPFGSHNDWVTAFFESGIIGLVTYLWLGWRLSRALVRADRPSDASNPHVSLATGAVLFAGFFASLGAAELLEATATLYVVGALAAAGAVLYEPTPRSNQDDTPRSR